MILQLGTRPKPTLEYDVSRSDGNITDEQRTQLIQALAEGKRIWANIYNSKLNPLNGKVIGPDESFIKGQGFLTQVEPTIRFQVTYEQMPAETSNVLAGLQVVNGWNWGNQVWGELAAIKPGQEGAGQQSFTASNVVEKTITDDSARIDLKDPVSYVILGKTNLSKGDYSSAIANFSKALELNPNLGDAYYLRGTSKKRIGDMNGAIADYSKAIEIQPRYLMAYYSRGCLNYDSQNFTDALFDYRKVVGIGISPI